MERIDGQPAFVLHTRPYRDSSALVDLLTLERGRVRGVARGARRAGSRWRSLLQPFVPLLVGWRGRGELKTLTQLDSDAPPLRLEGQALWCGLYLNELLQRLLPVEDPHPELFVYYRFVTQELSRTEALEPLLRMFERQLIESLGYGFSLTVAADSGEPLEPGRRYRLDPGAGLLEAGPAGVRDEGPGYGGRELLAIDAADYRQAETRRTAKRLMRQALDALLGGKPLRSRELFVGYPPKGKGVRRDAEQ